MNEKFGSHGTWNFNSTKDDIRRQYQLVHNFTEQLRTLAPDSGAYFVREVCSLSLICFTDKVCQNEGDVYEPDHESKYVNV